MMFNFVVGQGRGSTKLRGSKRKEAQMGAEDEDVAANVVDSTTQGVRIAQSSRDAPAVGRSTQAGEEVGESASDGRYARNARVFGWCYCSVDIIGCGVAF